MNKNIMIRRLLAVVCDLLFLSLPVLLFFILRMLTELPVIVPAAVLLLIVLFYQPVFCSLPARATPGMLIAGIQCRSRQFDRVGFGSLMLRNFVAVLTGLPLGAGFLAGFFSAGSATLCDLLFPDIVITAAPDRRTDHAHYPRITEISGGKPNSSYRVPADGLIIGRDEKVCGVLVPEGKMTVSRCHCRVGYNFETGMFLLEDMGSVNGVYLMDGKRIPSGGLVAIQSGTAFYLGTKDIAFRTVI